MKAKFSNPFNVYSKACLLWQAVHEAITSQKLEREVERFNELHKGKILGIYCCLCTSNVDRAMVTHGVGSEVNFNRKQKATSTYSYKKEKK